MAIDRTKLKQIHNLLAQNGFAQDYSIFEKKFAGNANYGNRKKVYDLITENGGDIGGSYEDFMKRLQSKPKTTPKPKQHPSKPKTTSQRAMQFVGRQLPKPKRAPSNASPFVQSLYAKDMAERGEQQPTDYVSKREDYTSPKAVQNMSRRSQMAGRNAAKSAAKEIDKQYMQSQPVMNTGTSADEYVGKTERQLEKQMSDAADQFVKNNMSSYIANAVSGEQDAALQRALNATDNVPSMAGLGGMGLMVKGKTFNEQVDPDLMIKNLEGNLDKNLHNIFSNPQVAQKIEADARNLGVSVDTYIQRIVPSLRNSLANALNESEYQRALPKNMLDNVANRFINSNTLGKMIRLATQTRSQRVMNEQAMAATEAGENPYYKSGAIENVAADVGGMVLDPVFGGAAKGGAMVAGKLVGSAAKAAAVMANGTLAQRLGMQAVQTVVGSGTTGLLFDSTSSVVQNFSTGEDTSLGNTLKTALVGGAKGALNFGIMGLTGLPLSQLGRGVGIKAGGSFWGNVGRATGKVSLEAGKTYMEGMGMYLGSYAVGKLEGAKDANGKPIEFDLFDGTLESLPTAIGFRVQHALGGLKGGRKNAKGEDIGWLGSTVANVKEFLTSDKAKTSNMLMSEDERQQIFNSGAQNGVMRDGENIVSYAKRTKKNKLRYDDPQMYADPAGKESIESDVEMMKNTYDQIMADPKVSWDAKAKFSAMVMGVMPDSRPMMDYCTFTTEKVGGDETGMKKYINEYSADGTLLSKTSYDNTDKREQALYKMAMTREGQRLWNVMGTLVGIDKNNYDYQNAFFMERVKDAKDGAEIQAFADGMGTKGSAVEQEFTNWVLNNGSVMKAIDAFAQESGMKKEDIVKLMNKDPLHRTEEEQLLCVKLRREMEKQAFPADKVHEEQSNLEGKDVADDNNLGSENPTTEAVVENLDNLSKAEEGVEALMRDNDVFGDNFKKMQEEGMTNPQIYDWMIQNGGMTQEQLKPFADYINANARVQGMQQRTQQKIEELVGKVVHDWSYRGTMNGVKTDGEQVLFVEDRDGRRLMVGSGDVAFDSVTGRAKEDVGDMLVCLDPETKELVYMKAEDAKFVGVQNPDEFANEYRQKLQEINSQPYNEAMQRQAERDAAKNQQETNEGETKTEVAAPEAPMPEEDNPELYKVADSLQGKIGQSLSKDEADSLVSEMENRAEPARELELTPENWIAEFGEDGKVGTPIGEVKMGENQYLKLARLGRRGKLGMVKPTLENPDLIIEDASRAKEGDTTERGSSYVFVKSFIGKDGERMYHFTSVTVQKDGKEVVISNQEKSENRIKKLLQDGKVVFIKGESSLHPKAQMEESVPRSDSQGSTSSDNQTLGLGVNSPELSVDKDTNNSSNGNGNEGTLTHSAASYEKNDIPVDKDGEPAYEQVPKERTVGDLFGKLGGDGNLAHSFAEAKVAEAEKEQKALLKKEPKMGTKINEYLRKKREHEDAVKAAEAKVAYWNDVKGEIEKLTHTTLDEMKEQQAELDGTAAAAEHKALYGEGQPADGTALAAKFVADAKITPDSFKKETGFGTAEQAGFVGMIAKEENGGKSVERLAEGLVYYDNTEYNGTYFHGDTNEARNAIISALGAARTRKGLRELAQPDLAKFESERAQERDNAYHEAYGMDYEEYLAYSEQEMPHILEKINNFDEEKYLQDKAEEITNQIDKEHGKAIGRDESAGEEPVHGEGDKVLPGTRTDERGGGESPEEHAGRTEAERRSDTENATLPEEAPTGAGRVEAEQKKEAVKAEEPKQPLNPIERTALEYHEEKVGAARKAYEEAKASGDESETKRTRDEFKKALDDKLKTQGMGLVQRRKEIANELGKEEAEKIDKPWKDMDGEERMAVAEQNPLTEEEIRSKTSEENQDLIEDAIDYLNGNHGFAQQIAYLKIYDDVRNRHENVSGDSGTGDRTQLDAANTTGGEGLGLGRGRESGGSDGPVDRGAGNEAASGERTGGESGKDNPTLPVGKQGDKQGEGSPSGMGGLSAGGADATGGGAAGGDGHVSDGSGRGGIDRSSKPDARRKPAAKQGTTWRNRTGAEIKQEAKEAKEGLKAALKEMLKRGRGEASISLTGLNSRQIEYVPELMKAVKRYGMSLIDQGIYKVKDWMNNIREGIYDDMKAIGFTDRDIDDFIEEMWNSKMPMDGETHTIAEWSAIYSNSQLRKKLSEKLGEKYERQMAAEPIAVKVGDRKNIEETLPFLLPQQQEDVLKAETQFFGNEHADREHAYGKGYLFTNGTGTGKTYTGLGIAKRLAKQGKGRILFVTPSQKKVNDWMKDGKNLGLDIRDLDSWAKERGTTATTESGEGMVITTFANFGLNKKLLETEWDAVIYDECHRIMENKKGAETARSMQHYMMTNRDENHCFLRLQETNKDYQKMRLASEKFDEERSNEIGRIMREYKESHPEARTKDVINATYKLQPKELNSFAPADAAKFPKLGKAYQEFMSAKEHYYKDVEPKLREQAKNTWKRTKTIFLSATPFNTRENLDYVEGYIFKYPEMSDDGMNGRTRFYLDHFGAAYKYRYHRLEQTVSNPDAVAKQEVAFSDYLQNTLGTMSGRIIDSPYDYSRDFPTVSPDHAEEFNIAVQDAVRGRYLGSAYRKTIGEYNYGSALFETMKVANIIDRIKQHLDAGRKVVIFHRRTETKTPIKPPFAYMLEVANKEISLMRPGKEREEYIREVNAFRKEHAGLLQWEKTLDYSMPREQLAKVFGKNNVLFFSGKESKTVKDKAVDTFNDDNSGKNIIVIQEASGKEGISLHDTTGKHQRVCITLGLPQSPITALQIEGRTYRIGNKSNAIFEYPVLGLNSEMMLFGEKFNNQVSTTENLALGSQARNLRESFAKGILEHSGIVPIDQQGVGGKEFDAPKQGDSDPFDDAVLDYYSNQKLNRKNREGVDYFPTPEPLGYKMMEWARAGEGDTILEPSAGHGAIARYAPKENQLTGIEPSQSLFTKLQLKAGGLGRKFMNTVFENYDISNKHDVVVMNPPFGTAGATAIAHLDKAFKHLEEGGRVVAIIPRGSTDKKFDKWLDGQKNVAMRAEVDLPDIVFQQAGTSVVSRVVVLDKITDAALRSKAGKTERIDLSGRYDKIEDFFEELRKIEMPERIIDTQAKMQKKAKAAKASIKEIKGVRDVKLDKNGILVSMRGDWMDYGISFSGSDKPQYWREKMSNFYEKYEELEKSAFDEDKKAVFSEMKELSCKLAGMTEDEMQRYIAGRRNSGEQDGVHFRTEEDIEDVNKRFNERLESLKADPKQKGGELKLGYPGTFLKDAGFGDSEIVLEYAKIERKSSEEYKNDHPFDVEDIKDLPKAINAPIAVFDNTNGKEAGKTILTELQKDGKNFIVAIRAAERRQKGGIVLEVNEIKTLFPKEARGIVNWFNTGKTCNVDKEKALTWLGALRTHRGTWLTEQELSSATNVVKDFDIEKRKSLNFRIGDNKTEKQNNSVATISEDAPVVVKHVDRVSKETGVKVNMVQSAEEVSSPRVKKALEDGEQVTGWYDEKTGEVHLYMPNIHDRYTAEKTIWHETVGHKGMRGLMGEQFDRFLRDVWYDLDKPENAELKKLVDEERRRNPLNIYDAIEEGIARLAEEGRGEPGFWRNIRNKVTDFFREIGYRIAPNTKDVKYLLWLSKNLQKNPNDVFYKMRAEAVRWRLDHETVPDVIEANGMFFDNDGKAHKSYLDMSKEEYEEATDGEIHLRTTPSAGTAIDRYHRALNEHGYMFTESYMDNMLSLQKLMLAIKPGMKIEDIKSSENPYMLQNTMQGKMSIMAQRFNDDVMEPLNKVMAKALDAFDGKNQTEKTRSFNLYMIAKHGLERNRVFFVRDYIRDLEPSDAEILQRQWDAEKKDLGDKLRNGQIDLKEYYKTMDEWIRNNVDMDYKADEHDYSGFHGLQEIDDKKAPYDDAEAIQSVMDSEAKMEDIKNGSVADLWSKINTATRYSLDLEYDGSMLTKENHDHVSEMFDWYVPLRKYDEATAEDMYGYVSENGDASTYIGPALMKATGRKSLSNVNVLAQIGAMGNMSISRYGNNAVKMAFARFVRSNGGQGLVTETNLWVEKKGVDNNGKPIWEEAYPKIPENATADEISKIVSDFETDMKAKQAKGEARNLSARGHIGFKFERAKDRDQHIVDVMIAGKTHRFVVNGNPRAAQALNGLLEHKAGGVGRVFATISRFMAQTCTSYNPEFVMRNMIRDFEFASSNLLAKEGLKYTKVFEKYYAKVGLIEGIRNSKIKDLADTGGFGLYAKYRNGTLDTSNKIQGYFKEFMDNGGETGWVQVKNMKDLSKEYRRNIKTERSKVAKVGKGFYNLIFKNLENVNEIAENMARFATYCASRDSGRSVVRSAYDAKEVSTNFNRHGSASAIKSFKNGEMSGMQNARKQIYRFTSSYFRNTSMFFNAGIQSTNLLIKNFKHNPIGTAGYIAAGPMITAGLMALLNNVMIASEDEKDRKGVKDPYGELPDYIRRNNLCVYIGEGEFVTIPLAIEERAFYGLGDFVAGMTFADNISSQKMANLAENKKVDKWLNPAMDAVGCLSQLVPVMDYLGHASFGKEPVQETVKGFAPSAISPIVEWLYNSDWKGSPIQRDDKFDEEQPSWMLAYKGTPDFLVDINKKVNAATNTVAPGNENMKGNDFWDAVTNPSALQHFYSGYMGGAATFAERAVGLVKKGKDVETKDIPFVRSLLYTPNEQSSLQRTKTKWYNYQDEMAKTMSNVKRLKSKNVPADQLLRNYSDYFKFQDSKEAMKVQVIEEADKMIKEWKKLRNKSSDTESINYANHNIEMTMQDAVEKLDKLN